MSTDEIKVQIFPDGRLDVPNAASYLGLKEKTLAMMRCKGTGPKYIKRGKVFYYQDDLNEWIQANGKLTSTSQYTIQQVR